MFLIVGHNTVSAMEFEVLQATSNKSSNHSVDDISEAIAAL